MKKGIWLLIILVVFTATITSQALSESNYQAYLTIQYLLETQEYQQAETAINQYLKKFPDDPFILTEKARVMRKLKGKTSDIIKILKKSLAVYPDYYLSNFLMATTSFLQYLQKREKQTITQEAAALDLSIHHLKKSIGMNSRYPQSYFWLGVITHEKGMVSSRSHRSTRAKHLFVESNKQLVLANKIEPSPEAYYYMALNHEQLNNIPQKMAALKSILEFSPYDYNTLAQLSNIYLNNKNYKMAANYLEKLALIDPSNKKIGYNYLFSLFALREGDKFLKASSTINISDSPILQYAKAYFLYKKRKWLLAENLIKSFASTDFKSQLLLANIYLEQYEYFKAYQILTLIKKPPSQKLYLPLYLKTLSHLNLNNKVIGIFEATGNGASLKKYLSLEEFYIVFHSYIKTNQSHRILEIVKKLRKENSQYLAAMDDLFHLLDCLAKSKPITAQYLKNEENLFLTIHYLKSRQHYHHAIAVLRKSLKHGRTVRKMVEMASLYYHLKEYKKTENLLMKLRQKHTSSATIKNFYAYFLASQNRRLKLARKMAEFCLKRDAENPAYLDTSGYILLRLGLMGEAEEYLLKAYNKNPFQPEIINHVIQYYRSTNKVEKVTEIYQRAINHNVDFKNQLMIQLKNVEKSYR